MRYAFLAVLLVCLSLVLAIPAEHSATVNPSLLSVVFLNQAHQTVATNCYNAQITLNITYTGRQSFLILFSNIYLYENAPGLTVTNQSYYANANNTLTTLRIFPNNPIVLIVTFANYCIIPTVGLSVYLFYDNPLSPLAVKVFP